ARVIAFVGDTDNFTFNLDPGQKISVLVTPTSAALQPTVTLKDPASVVLASGAALAAGQKALVQSISNTTGGTYTITVGGANSTIGLYTIQLIVNGSFETEANNTLATAQSIDDSFLTLSTADASGQRGGLLGMTDGGTNYLVTSPPFSFTDISTTGTSRFASGTDNANIGLTLPFTFNFYGTNFTTINVTTNGLMTFGTSNTSGLNDTLSANPTQAAIAPFWDDLIVANSTATASVRTQTLGVAPNRQFVVQWDKVTFVSGGDSADPITFQAILNEAGNTVQFNYLDLLSDGAAGNDGGSATAGI